MKSLKKARNPKQVMKTLELLDSSGLDVCSDEILLNTVVETCIWNKQNQRLEQVLKSFHASGLRPSVPTYGSLIKACSYMHRIDQCWVLWRQIVDERGMEPSDIVLGCMLDALVCNDSLEAAVQLINEWKGRVKPNTVMYSTIIKGFAATRQSSRAMDMWREMLELKIPMNTVAYNALIDAQARVGAMEEVETLVTSMQPNGCTPDVITFSTIVKGYCVKGELNKALEVFQGIERNGMVADAILVKMYGRRGQLDKAFEVVATMPTQYGFTPNAQVRTCLMCACVNNRSIRRGFEVFEDIKKSREGAGVRAYGALLSGCVRHGHLEEAAHLVEEAYGLKDGKPRLSPGENFESERLEQLFRSLSQRGLFQKVGAPLMERLRAKKVPVNFNFSAAQPNTGRDFRNCR